MKLSRFQPTLKYLAEPQIEVGQGIEMPEPKMGWTLLGPLGDSSLSYTVKLGLIGDNESLEKTKNLFQRLSTLTYGKSKSFLHVDFPGLERLRVNFDVMCTAEIDEKEIREQIEKKQGSFSDRVEICSLIFREKIQALAGRHPSPEVIVLAYPKIVDYYCVEGAIGQRGLHHKTALEKAIEKTRSQHIPLDHFLGAPLPTRPFVPMVLRSIVKAICMDNDIPVQIIRPRTTEPYDPERPKREDDATIFWNLVVALFYKANHLPWRARGLMEDSCYLGISFFRDTGDPSAVKTALAQVFSLDAEGFVFKGERATVDESNSPHISKVEAARLTERAISVYKSNKNKPPDRLVVHKTSRFNDDELEGFKAGASGIRKLDLVAFGTRGLKLIRWGHEPPIRGTMVRLPDRSVLLYTLGYIPYLDMYPGPHVPSPLEILEHHGDTNIDSVCEEILALTKLNWNNAKFCTKSPITIGFARRVGEILREAPPNTRIQEKFKFYM